MNKRSLHFRRPKQAGAPSRSDDSAVCWGKALGREKITPVILEKKRLGKRQVHVSGNGPAAKGETESERLDILIREPNRKFIEHTL